LHSPPASDRLPLPAPPKINDTHVGWTDADGNTAMHVAAWSGDLRLVRTLLDHPNARKMAATPNKKGATPIIMAAIAGQVTSQPLAKHVKFSRSALVP
jgi:ankyrin repeat protein